MTWWSHGIWGDSSHARNWLHVPSRRRSWVARQEEDCDTGKRTAGLVARPSSCTNRGTFFLAVASSTRQNLPSATHACACNSSHLSTHAPLSLKVSAANILHQTRVYFRGAIGEKVADLQWRWDGARSVTDSGQLGGGQRLHQHQQSPGRLHALEQRHLHATWRIKLLILPSSDMPASACTTSTHMSPLIPYRLTISGWITSEGRGYMGLLGAHAHLASCEGSGACLPLRLGRIPQQGPL